MTKVRVLGAVSLLMAAAVSTTTAHAAPLEVARALFEESFDAEQRAMMQILLIAGGYTPVVPQEHLTKAGYDAIKTFEADVGLPVSGVLDQRQVDKLVSTTAPMMGEWGFQKVAFPGSAAAIWAPMGLGIRFRESASGLHYKDAQRGFELDMISLPGLDISKVYKNQIADGRKHGATIKYDSAKNGDNWFAIASTWADGTDHYYRYHQDGNRVTGFAFEWDNRVEDFHGERVADIMSGSLRAAFTGAVFPDPPAAEVDASRMVAQAAEPRETIAERRRAEREQAVEERRSAAEHEREAAEAERRAIAVKEATAKAEAELAVRQAEEAKLAEIQRQQAEITRAEESRKAAAERQTQIALAEQATATAKASAARAEAEASAAASKVEAERLKRVDEASKAAKVLAVRALDCGRRNLRSLIKSGEGSEVLTTVAMTMCEDDVDHFLSAGVTEYRLEHQVSVDRFADGAVREKLRAETREHIMALAVQAKAGIGDFATTSSN